MEIFIPLAYYIGAYRIKSELEDISFRYLKPDAYKSLEEKMCLINLESDACLKEMVLSINEILDNELIPHDTKVRTKNIFGIYKRMTAGYKISDIHDLLSLKIMVDTVKNCYTTLGLIHEIYHPINSRFKDFICNPKTNLYSSLHTTVFAPNDKLVQTQIRTFEMDKIASFGLTSYWDIKKGNARDLMQEDLKNKSQFFKSLTDIDMMFKDNQEFVHQVKYELFADKVYVYNSRGERIELPKGSNIIDYAYYKEIGEILIGAKVNNQPVKVDYVLKNEDRIITYTDELSYGPRLDWLDMANTEYAKKKIKEFKV